MENSASVAPNKRIIIFERDPDSLTVFKAVCDDLGYDIVVAADRDSGIASLTSNTPDLVIADIEFPRLPGFVLLEEITKKKLAVPVAIIGSHPEDILKALRSGAADFFRKPVNRVELASRIAAIIGSGERVAEPQATGKDSSQVNKLERENKELKDLLEISSSLDVSGDSKRILQHLTDLAAQSMNCEAASIMLKNERENTLEFVVASGEKGGRLETIGVPLGEGIAGWVALYGKPLVVNDTSKDTRFTGKIDQESGFVTRQILAVPMMLQGEIKGVLEVINSKDNRELGDDDLRVLNDITERAALVISTTKKIEAQENFYIQITNILVKAIEKKELYVDNHSWKVAELCHKIGFELGLSENEMTDLYFGSLLHDIGKLEIPGILLSKKNLSEREKDFLRQHPVKGAKLIEQIIIWKSAVPCILYHHENWDGSGYPFGRSGDSIPILARIINIAESYSVMRSPNSYKRQLTLKESILEIMRGAGKQFDPDIVKAFIRVLEKEAATRNA